MNISESLSILGLNDKQSAIYIALLQIGRGSAYAIADKAHIKRPTAYVVLSELIEKGLVSRVPRVKKKLYVAVSPEQAFALAEEKLTVAKTKLPELLAMTRGSDTKANVLYFEGIKGIKQVMEYKRDEDIGKEFVGFYATSSDLPDELTEYFEEWNEKNRKRNITMRGIVPEHDSLKIYRDKDARHGRNMKMVPYKEFPSEVAIDISERIVRIHDYKNLQGIAIENVEVAKTMREIFEMVWSRVD